MYRSLNLEPRKRSITLQSRLTEFHSFLIMAIFTMTTNLKLNCFINCFHFLGLQNIIQFPHPTEL